MYVGGEWYGKLSGNSTASFPLGDGPICNRRYRDNHTQLRRFSRSDSQLVLRI
jgi:hypothetical protein